MVKLEFSLLNSVERAVVEVIGDEADGVEADSADTEVEVEAAVVS